ncbi:hypothetical protein A200_05227 [Parascardovia denticolens IPLA 20019]|nr:hypothetical protein A200_05227 [Parascardovia denticolens IPLA 20019]
MSPEIKSCEQSNSVILNDLEVYTEAGLGLARSTVKLLDEIGNEAVSELQGSIKRFQRKGYRDKDVTQSLAKQLESIRINYELLSQRMNDEVNALGGGTFVITLFGRTTAGKSTLMTILTHGDGSQIGNGSQRTTRDVRTYEYRKLKVIDAPGIAAFEGNEDEDLAFETAKQGDLILFLITDDAPQRSEAQFFSRIKSLGKPIICLVNVKVGILNGKGYLSEDSYMDFRDDLQDKFDDTEGLRAIRNSLVNYGPEYGQDWNRIPFAFVHLKSACMAQQPEYAEWADKLYRLSHFDDAIALIEHEVQDKGGFYRFKAYTDIASVPLVDALEELSAQSAENSNQGRLLIQKKRKHDEWIDDFEERAEDRIETLLTDIAGDLKREANSFSEDNYNNRRASSEWAEIVKGRDIQTRANDFLAELEYECEDELRDIGREIEFDIRASRYMPIFGNIKARGVVDTKKIWNWATTLVAGGLGIAAIAIPPLAGPLAVAGTIVGIIGASGGCFFDDFEKKKKTARRNMQKQLYADIDKRISRLRRQLNDIVSVKIVDQQLRPTSRKISDVVSALFDLSATQRNLARRINIQQGKLSSAVVSESLTYLGYDIDGECITRVARIPGETMLLLLADGTRLPYGLKRDLTGLLDETIRYVFDSDDTRVLLSRTIGRACERRNIRIEDVKGEPLIAHITGIDELDNDAQAGIRLGVQVTELLITS